MGRDLRTRAVVLRRTNYAESDRILTLLTPEGKVPVLAHGVRKEKSRLAGSIELFTIADVVIHEGRARLATLTSAKMLQFFRQLLSDLEALELASDILRQLDRATEQVSSPDYFRLLCESLDGLNRGLSRELVRTWFLLNLTRIGGEELNLIYDINGEKLSENICYNWDFQEKSLSPNSSGDISSREIKLARCLLTKSLMFCSQIENSSSLLPPLLKIARAEQ